MYWFKETFWWVCWILLVIVAVLVMIAVFTFGIKVAETIAAMPLLW